MRRSVIDASREAGRADWAAAAAFMREYAATQAQNRPEQFDALVIDLAECRCGRRRLVTKTLPSEPLRMEAVACGLQVSILVERDLHASRVPASSVRFDDELCLGPAAVDESTELAVGRQRVLVDGVRQTRQLDHCVRVLFELAARDLLAYRSGR